jgi:DNA-binding winged helix-turn-helix (wHTH) protein
MSDTPKIYTFDDFRFEADTLALYFKDVLVKTGDKKTMQVLAVLLLHPNKITTQEEIIEKVWKDNRHGVTSVHLGQYISRLRKIFAEKNYIETVKGRGYLFIGEIVSPQIDEAVTQNESQSNHLSRLNEDKKTRSLVFSTPVLALLLIIPFILLVFLGWTWFFENNEEEIKQVVKDSQLYESLVLYKNPKVFKEEDLNKYWTAELDTKSNYDRQRIRESIGKLVSEGRRYGDETRCELFEFQSVEINQEKNLAVVKTLEKWFISVYFDDGTLQRNRYVGPYFVSYIVRQVNGQWLIEKSTTARVNRPTPRLSEIETISEAKSGKQFFVKIIGQDFEPETVYIEIVGEGCPASKPCKVPNSALREISKLTETVLDNVPLTLASGNFQITVRNGDSQPSDAVQINVP